MGRLSLPSGSLYWPLAQRLCLLSCWDTQWTLCVCVVCVTGQSQEGVLLFSHKPFSHQPQHRRPPGKSSIFKRQQTRAFPIHTLNYPHFPHRFSLQKTPLFIFREPFFLPPFWMTKLLFVFVPPSFRHPSSFRVCVRHLLQRKLKAFLCLPCHHGLFNNYPNKVNDKPPPLLYVRPPPLTRRSDEWGHQACQLPRR